MRYFLCLFCGHAASAAGSNYVLTGKVMDTDDNWLNDAKLTLLPVRASTHTDANGEFSLEFNLTQPLKPNKRKVLATLVVERHGHMTKKIPIKKMGVFNAAKPIEVKLSPKPVESGVGHSPADGEATWEFITEFLRAAMRVRLNADGSLKPIAIEQGWLGASYELAAGARQVLEVAPYAQFQGDKSTANWLPDAEFAKIWQRYGATEVARKRK